MISTTARLRWLRNRSAVAIPSKSARGLALALGLVRSWIAFALPLLAILLGWEMLVRAGAIQSSILPAPSTIVARAVELLQPSDPLHSVLLAHILKSVSRALTAFLFAVFVAVPLGFALGLSETLRDWLSALISLLLPLPAVAWAPILLVALGQGDATIVIVCFLGAVFPVLYSTIQGVQGVSEKSLWVLRSMGASHRDLFFRALLPATIPTIMTGLKLGIAHSWRTLVAAEMLAAMNFGLGQMIFAARTFMDTATMFVGIFCLAILGMVVEQGLFVPLEAATVRKWYGATRSGGGNR